MANAWKVFAMFTTEDDRLQISLQSPTEEPQSYYLDIRRTFELNGKILCTRRGIRVATSAAHIDELENVIKRVAQGVESWQESGGLQLIRRNNKLRIRKVLVEGEVSICLILNPEEVQFLSTTLPILRENIDVEDPENDDELEIWF